jgi:uncharacterized protein YjiS (DUF1127 family)
MTNLPVVHNTRARICGTALQSRGARRSRHSRWIAGMCDPNWFSAANTHQGSSILSKIRTVFGVKASSGSTHFCGVVERSSKGYPMPLQAALGPVRGTTQPSGRGTTLRRLIRLLRRWRERAHSRRELRELDDHILQDIGLSRDTLLREPRRPFWQ